MTKNIQKGKLIAITIIGVFLLSIIIMMFIKLPLFINVLCNGYEVENGGKVIGSYNHNLIVQYEIDNNTYIDSFIGLNIRPGDVISIYYFEDNPEKIYCLLTMIDWFIGLGLAFVITSLVFISLLINYFKKNDFSYLKTKGKKVIANIIYIRNNSYTNVEYKYQIICVYDEKRYVANDINYDLSHTKINDKIALYLSKSNTRKFYIDFTDIKKTL